MKARVVGTGGDQVKLRQLEATAKSKRAELERLRARFEANRARADSRAVPDRGADHHRRRGRRACRASRSKLPYAALVALAMLLFGIAIVVTRALFKAARTPSPAPAGGVAAGRRCAGAQRGGPGAERAPASAVASADDRAHGRLRRCAAPASSWCGRPISAASAR